MNFNIFMYGYSAKLEKKNSFIPVNHPFDHKIHSSPYFFLFIYFVRFYLNVGWQIILCKIFLNDIEVS